jgi:hypothetical protein
MAKDSGTSPQHNEARLDRWDPELTTDRARRATRNLAMALHGGMACGSDPDLVFRALTHGAAPVAFEVAN